MDSETDLDKNDKNKSKDGKSIFKFLLVLIKKIYIPNSTIFPYNNYYNRHVSNIKNMQMMVDFRCIDGSSSGCSIYIVFDCWI
jgi:hypothetical protein